MIIQKLKTKNNIKQNNHKSYHIIDEIQIISKPIIIIMKYELSSHNGVKNV